jgi:hypothetical protein
MERAMSETDFEQIIDAVRKEIALAPAENSSAGLRGAAGERPKVAADKRLARRHANTPTIRIRRVGEGQKRYR